MSIEYSRAKTLKHIALVLVLLLALGIAAISANSVYATSDETLVWDKLYGDENVAFVCHAGEGGESTLTVLHYQYDCQGQIVGILTENIDLEEARYNALAHYGGKLYAVATGDYGDFAVGDVIAITADGISKVGVNIEDAVDAPAGGEFVNGSYYIWGTKDDKQVLLRVNLGTGACDAVELQDDIDYQDIVYCKGSFYGLCYDGEKTSLVEINTTDGGAIGETKLHSVPGGEVSGNFGSAWMMTDDIMMFAEDSSGMVYAYHINEDRTMEFLYSQEVGEIVGDHNDGTSMAKPMTVPKGTKTVGAVGSAGDTSYKLAGKDEIYEYTIEYSFGNINHPWQSASIIDNLNEKIGEVTPSDYIQFFTDTDHKVTVKDSEGKNVNLNTDNVYDENFSTFTLDLADKTGAYGHLKGETYTITLYAKLKPGVPDEPLNSLLTDEGIPNKASLKCKTTCPKHADSICSFETNLAYITGDAEGIDNGSDPGKYDGGSSEKETSEPEDVNSGSETTKFDGRGSENTDTSAESAKYDTNATQTGDDSNMVLYAGLAALAALVIAGITISDARRRVNK